MCNYKVKDEAVQIKVVFNRRIPVLLHLEIHSMYSLGLIHIANELPLCETHLKLPVRCTDVQVASLKNPGPCN